MTATTKRMIALVAAGMLATSTPVFAASTAFADDLNSTSDATVSAIQAEPWPAYTEGDAGVDVLTAKLLIAGQGIDPGTEDEAFDPEFTEAVLEYQDANNLVDDGELTDETWLLLQEQTFGEYGPGTSGGVVEAIQHQLNTKFGAGVDVDGLYGPATGEAVREAQEYFDIGVDGIVGPLTFRALVTHQDY